MECFDMGDLAFSKDYTVFHRIQLAASNDVLGAEVVLRSTESTVM